MPGDYEMAAVVKVKEEMIDCSAGVLANDKTNAISVTSLSDHEPWLNPWPFPNPYSSAARSKYHGQC
jgi:hypothetical protein